MSTKNKHVQPFIMVLSATIALLVASQFNTQWTVFGFQTKKIEPFSDIIPKGLVKKIPLPKRTVNETIIRKDSTELSLRKNDISNIEDFENDSTTVLAHFFQSLNEIRKHKRKIRIAYFGDSMIEGDLITQDLRGCMQDLFGGSGVGFVPITSIVAGFRTSVIHSFDGWTTYNLLNAAPSNHLLGISGYGFVPNTLNQTDTVNTTNTSWVKYATVNRKHIDKFYITKLLYGKSESENFVSINGMRYQLNGRKTVNELVINSEKACQYVNARFQCKTPLDIFGFSLESDSGVFVDNFSFRGNSGMPITKVPQSVYSGTNECLGYDLIVLEYGLNAVSSKVTDYSWYERGMDEVIKHMQASFPNTSILLISIGDKSYRHEGVYETDPGVPFLVDAQKRMAHRNKLAFWSLYDAMGGNGSMIKWVEGDTVYANKDYTHFNFRGAHRVGKLLFNKLMSEYSDYNKKHKMLSQALSDVNKEYQKEKQEISKTASGDQKILK